MSVLTRPRAPRWHRLLAAVAALAMASCSDAPTAPPLLALVGEEPFVSGHVTRLPASNDDWGYLVEGPRKPDRDPNGAYFHLGQATLVWASGAPATAADIVLGRRASVWLDPRYPILESQPPKIMPKVVMLHEER